MWDALGFKIETLISQESHWSLAHQKGWSTYTGVNGWKVLCVPEQNIWQCLEICLVVATGLGDKLLVASGSRGQGCC
jgi:hypothetical protein